MSRPLVDRCGDLLAASEGCLDPEHPFVRLDALGDPDHALWVLVPGQDGVPNVRFYSEREVREHLQDLRVGEVGGLERWGRGSASFARLRAQPELAVRADDKVAPPSVQTALEAAFQSNTKLLEQVKGVFSDAKPGACPESFQRATEVVHWRLQDASGSRRDVPFMVVAHTCFFGNFGTLLTTLPVQDPALPGMPTRIRVCSTQFRFEDERRVMLRHTIKYTQIGFSLGLGFGAASPVPVPTTPKEGDPAFENGKPKLDPATGTPVTFDFDLVRLHSKLKLEAWQRLVVDVGPNQFVCREG